MQNTNTPPIATIAIKGENIQIEIPRLTRNPANIEMPPNTPRRDFANIALWLIHQITGKPLGDMDKELADLLGVNPQTATKKRCNLCGLRYRKPELPLVEAYVMKHGIDLVTGLALPPAKSKGNAPRPQKARKTRKKTTPCPI